MSPDEKALLDAARDGDATAVEQCILRHTDTNCTLDLTDMSCIRSGYDVEDDDDRMGGSTPLHVACFNGGVAVAHLLLDNGADANLMNDYGHRPMDVAAENGHLDLVRLLLENGADPNEGYGPKGNGPLSTAAENAYNLSPVDALAYATLLIEHKADVNKIQYTETALHEAVRSREVDIIKLLIASAADVNIKGLEHGGTALHMAMYGSGDSIVRNTTAVEIVSLLLQAGGDRDAIDGSGHFGGREGKTAAGVAEENGHEEALALLRAET